MAASGSYALCTTRKAIILLILFAVYMHVCIIVMSRYDLIAGTPWQRITRLVSPTETGPALRGRNRTMDKSGENPSRTNPRDYFQFRYVINPSRTCGTGHAAASSVFLVNYVHSAVGNFVRRARVRSSWALRSNYRPRRVETVFFVGMPSGRASQETQAAVDAESRLYGDVVQVDVVDTYR